ncbi:MAG: prefoldin subunit beta [Nanoarchaeota archaeon]|nr:prefoldin subunit beta [Nanoarchaeota archaeon]MBU1030778.1 prefoldin subunit beta [Nanoarchaeota archaeon]MBU1850510.1 prefoldin subunit beta [Nanoarchaeota archaeon]
MSNEKQQNIEQLQLLEQNLQNFLMQKQQFQTQLAELESAEKELEKTEESFKIIGNIMVSVDKKELQKDIKSKKELIELRLKSLEKQEDKVKQRVDELQKEVLKDINKKNIA